MGKSETEVKLEKLLEKKTAFNRIEIQLNDKSIVIDFLTPKKAVEQALAYLFKVIEYFKYVGSILNVGSEKYKSIDIKKYFAHPMLRSELWNIEKNLLMYNGTIKYGGRVYIEIGPSPMFKNRLLIKTKTAWKREDFNNTLDSLTSAFKTGSNPKITKRLGEIIDEKIALDKKVMEERKEEFLQKRKADLELKIQEEKNKLAKLEEDERIKQEKEKETQMKEWRLKNRLFPIADLSSVHWDKRWMEDFDKITNGISNVKINSLEDEEFLRDYCDQIIDFVLHLDVYSINNDPEVKDLIIRRVHESKKEAIMRLIEPEEPFDQNIELRLQELIKQLPQTPNRVSIKPKPVPIEKEESKEKVKKRDQKEVPLFE